jgi:hypothetical protein
VAFRQGVCRGVAGKDWFRMPGVNQLMMKTDEALVPPGNEAHMRIDVEHIIFAVI